MTDEELMQISGEIMIYARNKCESYELFTRDKAKIFDLISALSESLVYRLSKECK